MGHGSYGSGLSGHLAPWSPNSTWNTVFVNRHRTQIPYLIQNSTNGYFGIPIRGNKIAFVLDYSGSMSAAMNSPNPRYNGKSLWKVTADEIMATIRSMGGRKYYYIRLYTGREISYEHKVVTGGTTTWVPIQNWVPNTPENIAKTQEFFDLRRNSAGGGNGAEYQATSFVLNLPPPGGPVPDKITSFSDFVHPLGPNNGYCKGKHRYTNCKTSIDPAGGGGGKPSCIFFMTDGVWPTIYMRLRAINISPIVPINTICLDFDGAAAELQQIATDSGGVYRFID